MNSVTACRNANLCVVRPPFIVLKTVHSLIYTFSGNLKSLLSSHNSFPRKSSLWSIPWYSLWPPNLQRLARPLRSTGSTWWKSGIHFRNAYKELPRICSISLCTATLTPSTLSASKSDLDLDDSELFFLDLGNERVNITHSVTPVISTKLTVVLGDMDEKVLVFIDDCKGCKAACKQLRKHVNHETILDWLLPFK